MERFVDMVGVIGNQRLPYHLNDDGVRMRSRCKTIPYSPVSRHLYYGKWWNLGDKRSPDTL